MSLYKFQLISSVSILIIKSASFIKSKDKIEFNTDQDTLASARFVTFMRRTDIPRIAMLPQKICEQKFPKLLTGDAEQL